MMTEKKVLNHNDEAVQTYLTHLQDVIARMARQSTHCKTWAVGISSAILVFSLEHQQPVAALIGIVPVLVLGFLDAFYLSLEQDFRKVSQGFVKKLVNGKATADQLFKMNPNPDKKPLLPKIWNACKSHSIYPLYPVMVAALLFAFRKTVPDSIQHLPVFEMMRSVLAF